MNELAQAAVITAIRNCAFEGMIDAAADRTSTETVVIAIRVRGENALPANRAHLPTHRMNLCQAVWAYRQAGNVQERKSANAAIGRKKNGEETLGGASKPSRRERRRLFGNNTRPTFCGCGLVSPDSVLTTAEDGLLNPRRVRRGRTRSLQQSIAATSAARQRCGWAAPTAATAGLAVRQTIACRPV